MKKEQVIWIAAGIVAVIALVVFIVNILIDNSTKEAEMYEEDEGSHDDVKIAAVGDSITHGFLLPEDETYPAYLEEILGDGYWVGNFGVNNTTAMASADDPYTETEAFQESLEFNPDIVLKMFGLNDSKDTNWNGADQFREEYEYLIDQYVENNSNVEIILMTPSKAFNEASLPGSINNENVREIVGIVKAVADERGYDLIDINQLSKQNSQWFDGDLIHPDSDGTRGIAEEVNAHIKNE